MSGRTLKTRTANFPTLAAARAFLSLARRQYFGHTSGQYCQYCILSEQSIIYRPHNNPFEYRVYIAG